MAARICASVLALSKSHSTSFSLSAHRLLLWNLESTTHSIRESPEMASLVVLALPLILTLVGVSPGASFAVASVDPCGPSIPDPRVLSSCSDSNDTILSNTTSGGPEPYAVQCLSNGTPSDTDFDSNDCLILIPSVCARMTDDTPSAPYTQSKWIWFNAQSWSIGYWLPGPYQGTNSAGQTITVKPSRITYEDGYVAGIFESMLGVCFESDEYDMATVNLAELPTEAGTGAPASGGSAQGYPSYIIAPQQVGGCEDTICYNADAVRVACNCF